MTRVLHIYIGRKEKKKYDRIFITQLVYCKNIDRSARNDALNRTHNRTKQDAGIYAMNTKISKKQTSKSSDATGLYVSNSGPCMYSGKQVIRSVMRASQISHEVALSMGRVGYATRVRLDDIGIGCGPDEMFKFDRVKSLDRLLCPGFWLLLLMVFAPEVVTLVRRECRTDSVDDIVLQTKRSSEIGTPPNIFPSC